MKGRYAPVGCKNDYLKKKHLSCSVFHVGNTADIMQHCVDETPTRKGSFSTRVQLFVLFPFHFPFLFCFEESAKSNSLLYCYDRKGGGVVECCRAVREIRMPLV